MTANPNVGNVPVAEIGLPLDNAAGMKITKLAGFAAFPLMVLALSSTGCHRRARVYAGVEYYAPLEPAVSAAANAAREQAAADQALIEAREHEAEANQRLAEAERAREKAIAARKAAEIRAERAAELRAEAEVRAQHAQAGQARSEAEARARTSGKITTSPAVVVVVDADDDSRSDEAPALPPAQPAPPAKEAPADTQWVD